MIEKHIDNLDAATLPSPDHDNLCQLLDSLGFSAAPSAVSDQKSKGDA